MNLFETGDNDITIPFEAAIIEGSLRWAPLKHGTVYANIHTLIRNAVGAAKDKHSITPEQIKTRVLKDISNMSLYLESQYECALVVYQVDYGMYHLPRHAKKKKRETPLQKAEDKLLVESNKLLKRYVNLSCGSKFVIPASATNRYVLTHMAIDLLNLPSNVKLLESHTGAIKSYTEFNTKLNLKPNERVYVPFNAISLFTFGDKHLIAKQPTDFCKKVLEVCSASNLTPLTTLDRIRFVVQNKQPALFPIIQGFK